MSKSRGTYHPGRRDAVRIIATACGLVSVYPVTALWGKTTRPLRPIQESVPLTFFGMHIHRADSGTPWPSLPFGSWRLWDAAVSWSRLESYPNQWDFSHLDKYVAMGKLTGVEMLLPLALSPGWASARPEEKSAYQLGNAAEPKEMKTWCSYVSAIARRYKGRIRQYELWNEPNHSRFFSGTPEMYLALARETHSILKAEDPANILVGPATTGDGKSLEWVERFLSLGGGSYLDVLSHHFYVAHDKPEVALPYVMRFKALMTKYGLDNKPLWNTETGWWIENEAGQNKPLGIGGGWKMLGAKKAAAYVSRALILAWAAGIQRFYWYSWDHGAMGLIEPSNGRLKPAALSYKRTWKWLQGARMLSCTQSSRIWTCRLNRDGSDAWLIWTESDVPQQWTLPESWHVTHAEPLDGEPYAFDGRTVTVDTSPLLLSDGADWSGKTGAKEPGWARSFVNL